jgi:hypothetical protein
MMEQGIEYGTNFYSNLRQRNILIRWYLMNVEMIFEHLFGLAKSVFIMFEDQLLKLDKIICRALDKLEEKYPSIGLPIEMVSNPEILAKYVLIFIALDLVEYKTTS